MKISYSAIETFKQCPQKYKFQEIDKIKAPKSKEAVFGTVIHGALKFLHSKEPRFPTKEALLEFYKQSWPAKGTINWLDDTEERIFKSEGERIISNYYDRLDKSKFSAVDLESSFSILIQDDKEPHILRGKVDRIDKLKNGVFEIIDYKTDRRLPSQESVDNNVQLSIYHLALTSRWPNLNPEEVRLSLYFLRHGEKLTTKRTKNQLENTRKEILSVISKIKSSKFSPNPSPLCDYCGYKPICPMWRHEYIRNENPLSQQEITEAVNEYFRIKNKIQGDTKVMESLKKIINEFCDQKKVERVFGDGGFITRRTQKRYSYNINKIKAILEPLRLWDEVATVDSSKLAQIIKALPYYLQKEIEQAREVESEYVVLSATAVSDVSEEEEDKNLSQ